MMTSFTMIETGRERGKCKHCGRKPEWHSDQPDPDQAGNWIAGACDPEVVKVYAKNVKRRGANRARNAATRDTMDSIGMRRVRGSGGGTYWE